MENEKEVKESAVEAAFCKAVSKLGGMAIKLNAKHMAGLPDRLVLREGFAHFVELKRKGKKPTPLQRAIHAELRKQGARVYIVDNVADAKTTAEEIMHPQC